MLLVSHLFARVSVFVPTRKLFPRLVFFGVCAGFVAPSPLAAQRSSKAQPLKEERAASMPPDAARTLGVMPFPKEIRLDGGKFYLVSTATVAVKGAGASYRVYGAASRFIARVAARTGLNFMSEGYVTPEDTSSSAPIQLVCRRMGALALGEDESYRLTVRENGVELRAETDIGVVRGLQTLQQLVAADEQGYYIPTLTVQDAPRFPWRGLLLDVARHFFSVDVVKKQIDLLAFMKMNVLHLHLTDDQGFRIESKTYPKLHEMGSDGQYYTQEQMRDILRYADERGVRIVPEFDLPGHSTSWQVGYPELSSGVGEMSGGPYRIDRKWGRGSPVVNPVKEYTYQFLDTFFLEMGALFPDAYMHIGGDENNGLQWANNPDIQAFMKANGYATKEALQNYFNKRLLAILEKHGKKMMGWDEIFVEGVPNTIMIQSWRGKESLYSALRKGYSAILSNGFYIDISEPTDRHYLNEPLPDSVKLTPEERARMFGGEACMWSEWVTADNLDSRIWPRTAAIAERLWSEAAVRDVENMYHRLELVESHLEQMGSQHETNVPMMLRRLAGVGEDITPLKTYIDVLEPVKQYQRGQILRFTYSVFYPLTGVADAARPDAKVARQFRAMTDRYLDYLQRSRLAAQSPAGASEDSLALDVLESYREALRSRLKLWKDNHERLLPIIAKNPRLKEIEEHSLALSLLAQTGLEAMERLERGTPLTPQWKMLSSLVIERAKQPKAQTDIMIVPAIERLVKAVEAKNSGTAQTQKRRR
jgi:hexosaminidase